MAERDVGTWYISGHSSHERDVQLTLPPRRLSDRQTRHLPKLRQYACVPEDLARLFPCQRDVAEGLENADAVDKEHYELGRRSVPPERLLNYDLGSGWKPLWRVFGKGASRHRVS